MVSKLNKRHFGTILQRLLHNVRFIMLCILSSFHPTDSSSPLLDQRVCSATHRTRHRGFGQSPNGCPTAKTGRSCLRWIPATNPSLLIRLFIARASPSKIARYTDPDIDLLSRPFATSTSNKVRFGSFLLVRPSSLYTEISASHFALLSLSGPLQNVCRPQGQWLCCKDFGAPQHVP